MRHCDVGVAVSTTCMPSSAQVHNLESPTCLIHCKSGEAETLRRVTGCDSQQNWHSDMTCKDYPTLTWYTGLHADEMDIYIDLMEYVHIYR